MPKPPHKSPSPQPGFTELFRIFGRKPVLEALKLRVVTALEISAQAHGNIINEIIELAEEQRIPIRTLRDDAWDEEDNTQGVIAQARPPEIRGDLKVYVERLPETPFPLLLILDGITDPHNFGAILRTAEAAGVNGVIIRERRQVQVTDVVVKASAGAAYLVPIFQVTNLSQTLRWLKEENYWSVAASGEATKTYTSYNWKSKVVLIVGAEGAGVSELLEKEADDLISIPMLGKVESLNVSVATGVLLFHAARQRGLIK